MVAPAADLAAERLLGGAVGAVGVVYLSTLGR